MSSAVAGVLEYKEVLDVDNTAECEESRTINEGYKRSIEHSSEPITGQWVYPKIKFLILKAQWERETAMLSSVNEKAMHPAYQQIVGMGQTAIPLILSEMKRKPGHWFWALKAITGEDPILPEQRGRIKEMTEAWLRWGREHGYLR